MHSTVFTLEMGESLSYPLHKDIFGYALMHACFYTYLT